MATAKELLAAHTAESNARFEALADLIDGLAAAVAAIPAEDSSDAYIAFMAALYAKIGPMTGAQRAAYFTTLTTAL